MVRVPITGACLTFCGSGGCILGERNRRKKNGQVVESSVHLFRRHARSIRVASRLPQHGSSRFNERFHGCPEEHGERRSRTTILKNRSDPHELRIGHVLHQPANVSSSPGIFLAATGSYPQFAYRKNTLSFLGGGGVVLPWTSRQKSLGAAHGEGSCRRATAFCFPGEM